MNKAWRLANPEQHRKNKRESARRLAEKTNAERRQRYAENPEPERERSRQFRQENPAYVKAAGRLRRNRERQAMGSHTEAEWLAILEKHGNRCAHCKKPSKLTRDHIVPLIAGGTDFAYNIQPLCRSCNSKKKHLVPPDATPSLFDNHTKAETAKLCGKGLHPKGEPGRCVLCARDRRDRWKAENPELHLASKRDYQRRAYAADPEKFRAITRSRYKEKSATVKRSQA